MSNNGNPQPRTPFLIRAVSMLLRWYPRHFGEELREDLLSSVELEARRVRDRRGGFAETRFLLKTILQTAWGGLLEWGQEARNAQRQPVGSHAGTAGDLCFALRALVRHRGFATGAIVTLTLGIGAVTAVFSVLSPTLLQPLPYPEAHRIVRIWELGRRGNQQLLSTPNFEDWRQTLRSFSGLAVHGSSTWPGPRTVLGGQTATRMRVTGVSQDFFHVMGVAPFLGRSFTPQEHAGSGAPVTVVGYDYWRTQLGGREDLGELAITVDEGAFSRSAPVTYTVVGVMPQGFDYPDGSRAWVPWAPYSPGRNNHNWIGIARLAPGVTLETAQAEISAVTRQMKEAHGSDMEAIDAQLVPLQDELVGDLQRPLFLLLGGAFLVLLITCINIAAILLARAKNRTPELAVRTALGADRLRLFRQLSAESTLLAAIGAVTGLIVGYAGSRVLLSFGPDNLKLAESALNLQTIGFTIGVALFSTLIFGTAPALASTRMGLAASARGAKTTMGNSGRTPKWGWVLGIEVAFAVVLVAGASLLTESLQRILAIDPGIRTENLVAADLSLPRSSFPDDAAMAAYFQGLEAQLQSLPGVRSVGTINQPPLLGQSMSSTFEVEGQDESNGHSEYRLVSPSYFETMDMSILRGRGIQDADLPSQNDVVVVNEALARGLWPDDDPLGKRIRNFGNDRWAYEGRWATVVGVVSDVRETGLLQTPPPTVYLPLKQRPLRAREATVFVKVVGNLADQVDRVRTTVMTFHPDVATEVRRFDGEVDRTLARERFLSLVSLVFALLALALACVGVFGVVSYSVAQRTFEIGIRVALGADASSILRSVTGSVLRALGIGVGVGILGAYALSRVFQGLLFGMEASDPGALLFSAGTLLLCGTLAALLPAFRGLRLDPLKALRSE